MFPCTSCGLCCQNISKIKELLEFDLGNGVCKYFNHIDNSCKIYDNRPQICRVDEMFKVKYNRYFSREEFYIENAKVCNSLQEQYKINESFRIRIKD
jgi:Fe-S-cluster containining protein